MAAFETRAAGKLCVKALRKTRLFLPSWPKCGEYEVQRLHLEMARWRQERPSAASPVSTGIAIMVAAYGHHNMIKTTVSWRRFGELLWHLDLVMGGKRIPIGICEHQLPEKNKDNQPQTAACYCILIPSRG